MAVVIYLNTQKINDFSTQHKEKRWLESVLFVPDFSRFRAGGTALKLLEPVTSDFKAINVMKRQKFYNWEEYQHSYCASRVL